MFERGMKVYDMGMVLGCWYERCYGFLKSRIESK
jgi:hypothetical protein